MANASLAWLVRRIDAPLLVVTSALLVGCAQLKSGADMPDMDGSPSGGGSASATQDGSGGSYPTGSYGGAGAGDDASGGGAGGSGMAPRADAEAEREDGWPVNVEREGGAFGTPVVQISVGSTHTCVILEGGRVRCWGWGVYGMLGYGTGNTDDIGDDETPASRGDVNVGGRALQISAGYFHTCAVLEGGHLRCWGWAGEGQLGYANTTNVGVYDDPASVGDVNVGGKVIQVATGRAHTCALLEGGTVRCWGQAIFGQLGYANANSIGDDEEPAKAGDVNVGGRAVQIAAGGNESCALLDTGALRCWGQGTNGQLGYGNSDTIGDDEAPAKAGSIDVGGIVTAAGLGDQCACAVLDDKGARCWGYSGLGQLGYPNILQTGDHQAPSTLGEIDVGGKIAQLGVGFGHTCAVLDTGAVRCWGINQYGQLGYGHKDPIGDDENPSSAGDVRVGAKVKQVGTGSGFTCAVTVNGKVRCWGHHGFGVLGYGNSLQGPIGDDEFPSSAGDVPVN